MGSKSSQQSNKPPAPTKPEIVPVIPPEHVVWTKDGVLDVLKYIEDMPIKRFVNGNLEFISEYQPEVQTEVISRLYDNFSRLADNLKACKFDPYSISKSHHFCQWVSEVTDKFSEYSPGVGSWGAVNIIGPPQTFPRYGDISTSWAPRQSSGTHEYLVFKYPVPVHICGVDVFETWNPGCLTMISVYDGENWQVIWKGQFDQPNVREISRVFSPNFPVTPFKSNWIRLDLDCTTSRAWTEIDCVRLRGREEYEWAPAIHHRFPIPFRRTVKVLLLVLDRLISTGVAPPISKDVCFMLIKQLAFLYDV